MEVEADDDRSASSIVLDDLAGSNEYYQQLASITEVVEVREDDDDA